MLIVCTSCATSYQVAPGSLGGAGRSVRCVRCGNVWFAANTGALAAIAETHRADVAAFAATTSVADFGAAAAAGDAVAEAPPRPGPAAEEPTLDDDAVVAEAPAADGPHDAHLAPEEATWTPAQEPDTIADAPALVPAQIEAAPLSDASPTLEDIESVAARRARRERRARRWSLPGLSTAILML
ncbi:MAG: zinc-ribbon domain, partial [Alphaproteobacteria bacterium]|nr:zinc-ribbon domain [Alphaproteobacteria bacterium]